MGTSYNRSGVKRRLVQIARHVLPDDVQVEYGWPGGEFVETSCMWLDYPEGDSSSETYKDQLKQDRFVIPVAIGVTGYFTDDEAEEAVEGILRLFDDFLRACQRLTHPDIGDGDAASYAGIAQVSVRNIVGPQADARRATSDRTVGAGLRFELACQTHLT